MYSHIVNGKVLDFHFKKSRQSDPDAFFIGDICLGQIWQMHRKNRWTAVSLFENPYGPVVGFATRLDAAEFLIKVFDKVRNENKEYEQHYTEKNS